MPDYSSSFDQEVSQGKRFKFGDNWQRFLKVLDDECIAEAEDSLKDMLGLADLHGMTFLDIGSGSGLSSLVARRLGAVVYSFDYDPQSVACTRTLKNRYFPDDPIWKVEQGSALDENFLASLGTFDIVYSWGVLHHTGSMWRAVSNAAKAVKPGGVFHIALYRTRRFSKFWALEKRLFNKCPRILQRLMVYIFALYAIVRIRLSGRNPVRLIREYHVKNRGMSWIRDIEDWLGGFPYEHATPDEVTRFMADRGFELQRQSGMDYVFLHVQTPNASDTV